MRILLLKRDDFRTVSITGRRRHWKVSWINVEMKQFFTENDDEDSGERENNDCALKNDDLKNAFVWKVSQPQDGCVILHAPILLKPMDSLIEMMNFVVKLVESVSQVMELALKVVEFVLKMMEFAHTI